MMVSLRLGLGSGVGLAMVVVAGCGYVAPVGQVASGSPTQSAQSVSPVIPAVTAATCSGQSLEATKQAVRDVPSYAYDVEGYVEAYEEFTPAKRLTDTPKETIRHATKSSGAYVAPDRLMREHELVSRDDLIEATRQIGDDVWVRFVGNTRWQQMESSYPFADLVLAMVEQLLEWTIDGSNVAAGQCRHVGTSSNGPWTVEVIVPVGSAFPTSVQLTQRHENPPTWGEAILQVDTYLLQPDVHVAIDPPPSDTSAATPADVRYYLQRRGCAEPPCDVTDFDIVYEAHNGSLDLFGYESAGAHGYIWFEDGMVGTTGSSASCPSEPQITFHTTGDTQWIGGRIPATDAATIHVRLRDGEVTDYAVSATAYIVPGGILGGPELETMWIVGPDGEELFRYNEPSPETGVPPPAAPSPAC